MNVLLKKKPYAYPVTFQQLKNPLFSVAALERFQMT